MPPDESASATGAAANPAVLQQWLTAARETPKRCALFCDVDGTLAPVVPRAEQAMVPLEVSRLLGRLSAQLGVVACVSGRTAADAKRLVGVGGVVYAGAHGAELLNPATGEIERTPELEAWREPVQKFVSALDQTELRRNGVRLEDKDFIQALHWRGAEEPDLAEELIEEIRTAAVAEGFEIHRGRMVLEIRPPVEFDKGVAVTRMIRRYAVQHAAYVGDDMTDLDAFDALRALHREGTLASALCIGVSSEEQPDRLAASADVMVDGPRGVTELLKTI
ncbi:MAG: trehalose-phosphatase [Actinobacteria bacterium]|nr:trehalose-phosphatase [Actinomycetota bacterium]